MYASITRNTVFMGAALLLLSACGEDPLEQAAQSACECVKPIYAEIAAVKQRMQTEGPGAVVSQVGLASADQAEQCLADVRKKYPSVDDKALEQRLLAKMEQGQCGDL